MQVYQDAYRKLFVLVMDGKANSLEADLLRQDMDRMPGTHEQKLAWGMAIGTPLYQQRIGQA